MAKQIFLYYNDDISMIYSMYNTYIYFLKKIIIQNNYYYIIHFKYYNKT